MSFREADISLGGQKLELVAQSFDMVVMKQQVIF